MKEIIDNFLSKEYIKDLENFVLSPMFPWYYIPNVSKPETTNLENSIETSAFIHRIYSKFENIKSFSFEKFEPLFSAVENHLDGEYELFRARIGMKHFKHGFNENNYNIPHVDFPYPHISAVFYLNNSDGDTWLFKQYFSENTEPAKFDVLDRVSPKQNRIFIFDGLQYHTASNPINSDFRIIVNLNFIKKGTRFNDERFKYLR